MRSFLWRTPRNERQNNGDIQSDAGRAQTPREKARVPASLTLTIWFLLCTCTTAAAAVQGMPARVTATTVVVYYHSEYMIECYGLVGMCVRWFVELLTRHHVIHSWRLVLLVSTRRCIYRVYTVCEYYTSIAYSSDEYEAAVRDSGTRKAWLLSALRFLCFEVLKWSMLLDWSCSAGSGAHRRSSVNFVVNVIWSVSGNFFFFFFYPPGDG